MARRPLPSVLAGRPPRIRRRDLARTAADSAHDVLHPLVVIGRGLCRQSGWVRTWWRRTPKDRRGPALFLASAVLLVIALMPYGPALALSCVMGAAAWTGRGRAPARSGPGEAGAARLQVLYDALVPYFSNPADPSPLYAHGGSWKSAFVAHEFEDGRLVRLHLRYPAYFTDGEAASRACVERLLHAKAGRGREYRFDWSEEDNHLTLTALPPLPTGIAAQRFVTAPGEIVLGFTDPETVQRTIPVTEDRGPRDAPAVVWRTGPRSSEPHLLALGRPGAGATTLLRSVALQALHTGDLLVVDGTGTGEHACLAGRAGVVAVEDGLPGTLAVLEWAAHETERRLIAGNLARQAGRQVPEDVRRPLWILVDRPSALTQLAQAAGRPDPQKLLDVPLRHGKAANVTVAIADQLDDADTLAPPVLAQTRARVVLGPVTAEQAQDVLGAPPCTTPAAQIQPGRGYARLGAGPVLRLQVPATPDPHDDEAAEAERRAVLALLPAARNSASFPAPPTELRPKSPGH